MSPALQSALLRLYRGLSATGLLATPAGRRVFEAAYMLYKRRLEAGPIEHLREVVRPGTLVIDVGANIGFFTRLFGRWVQPGGAVLAIEPEPRNLERLAALVERERLAGSVEVLAGVAAEASGTLRLRLNPHHPGDHKIGEDGLPVPAHALDDLMTRRGWPPVSLIKIDVQGAEERVLDGARQTLRRRSPALFLEVHDQALRGFGSSAERLLGRVAAAGYSLHALGRRGRSPAMTVAQALAAIGAPDGYADFLCLPPGITAPAEGPPALRP